MQASLSSISPVTSKLVSSESTALLHSNGHDNDRLSRLPIVTLLGPNNEIFLSPFSSLFPTKHHFNAFTTSNSTGKGNEFSLTNLASH